MNRVKQIFDNYLDSISTSLRAHGFTRSRHSFYLRKDSNIAVIHIQLSKTSDNYKLRFTFNIGVYSATLAAFYTDETLSKPLVDDLHWVKRIGEFFSDKRDMWFEISADSIAIEELTRDTMRIFTNQVIPSLVQVVSDKGLEELWVVDKESYVTEFDRLLNLSVLFCKRGAEEAGQYIAELKQYTSKKGISIEYHLSKLSKVYGYSQ